MPFAQEKKTYTNEDYDSFPEDVRIELIDGQIYYQAAPNRTHQKILIELSYLLQDYIKSNSGPCEVYPAPFAVKLNEDDKTTVEPDISVICDKSKLDNRGCNGAPDLIIEIVSPSNSEHDYILKSALYKTAGVREYWIVDHGNQMITVNLFGKENFFPQHYDFTDTIKVGIYEDLFIDFSKIDIK
ncbi:Uma2 family endonuclease [Lachnospiraceae bacterium ZAX-1]